jgi:hypothetical protein
MKDTRKRKYQEDFTKFGFTSIVTNGDERPQGVVCCEVPENESFNVNESMWHLKIKPGSHADRGATYFKINAEIVKKTRLDICGYCAKTKYRIQFGVQQLI